MSNLYERRVGEEWRLLQLLLETSDSLESIGREASNGCEVFRVTLKQTRALLGKPGAFQISDSHGIALHFPQFFPSVPIEASLATPVFHPNVHPENGFICLWNRFSPGDTVIEAIRQTQRVISWTLVNQESDHVMQPDALAWYSAPSRDIPLPLGFQLVTEPDDLRAERTYAIRPPGSFRRRLE